MSTEQDPETAPSTPSEAQAADATVPLQSEAAESEVTEKQSEEEASEPEDPLASAEKKVAALKEQLMRTAADFDNFRKRSRREVEEARAAGREGILKDLLPVFDNLERATAHADSAKDAQSLASGVDMVVRQFTDTLGKLGIERVPGVGATFDPTVHEAIQQIESAEHPAGNIAAEVQGGYRMGGRLIRAAMVVVSKGAAAVEEEAADKSED